MIMVVINFDKSINEFSQTQEGETEVDDHFCTLDLATDIQNIFQQDWISTVKIEGDIRKEIN